MKQKNISSKIRWLRIKQRGQEFYLPIKYSSFHPEAAKINYKELEVKRKKWHDFTILDNGL